MPGLADDYWSSYDLGTAKSIDDVVDLIRSAAYEQHAWVWRGHGSASWGLHSTLSRDIHEISGVWPDELSVTQHERKVYLAAVEWGLQWSDSGRLSPLELLALLRHFGARSRFVDVTRNAFVAVHNACIEEMHDDGRVIALDGRGHATQLEVAALDGGPPTYQPAWWHDEPAWWKTDYAVWTPPPLDQRIARQQGAFLLGGIPTTTNNQKWYRHGELYHWLSQEEVRSVTSVGAWCHAKGGAQGPVPERPVRTFRIDAAAKATILEGLRLRFGMSFQTLYPDAAGFVVHGQPNV